MRFIALVATTLCWLPLAVLPAQDASDVAARESEVDVKVTAVLLALAKRAENEKVPSLAVTVYEEILDHYDSSNKQARKGAGWREIKGEWQAPTAPPATNDTATETQRRVVEREELNARRKCAALHRDLGVALLAEGEFSRGQFQLQRALAHDPDDAKAHFALNHGEFEDFRGPEEQIALVRRFREIAAKAKELRELKPEVRELPAGDMPRQLQCLGRPIPGAAAGRVVVWVDGTQDDANRAAMFAERAMQLLDYLVPERGTELNYQLMWVAFVKDHKDYEAFVDANAADLMTYTAEQARLFGGVRVRVGSRVAECVRTNAGHLEDSVVAHISQRSWRIAINPACSEGLMHVMTWLLCGSMHSKYTALATTVTDDKPYFGTTPEDWLARMRSDVAAGRDWALADVLRERQNRFREEARVKSWLFVLWLCARHPDRWTALAQMPEGLPVEKVIAEFEQRIGRPVAEVDEEWRAWAKPRSRLGKATGLGR